MKLLHKVCVSMLYSFKCQTLQNYALRGTWGILYEHIVHLSLIILVVRSDSVLYSSKSCLSFTHR